ncbi:hypothetical protein KI387_040882, partial [Taxus chinensis]
QENFGTAWQACDRRWDTLSLPLKCREVLSPQNLSWSMHKGDALITIIKQTTEKTSQQYNDEWAGLQVCPPLLLSPLTTWQNNAAQSNDSFTAW